MGAPIHVLSRDCIATAIRGTVAIILWRHAYLTPSNGHLIQGEVIRGWAVRVHQRQAVWNQLATGRN